MTQIDRRQRIRFNIDVEALLKLPTGERIARLVDISESGARLQLPNPPPIGAIGALSWGLCEAFCKVVWSNPSACGIHFERAIAKNVVDETIKRGELQTLSVAEFSNIPLGKKRSR